jgi:hypothetical protein
MNVYELAKQIVCSIIAVALSMTVTAVENLLPHRPDWLERVANLAIQFKAVGERATSPASESPAEPAPAAARRADELSTAPVEIDGLLRAYGELWQFVHALRSEGLSLDEAFCERIEREWSVATLLAYMRNADRSLQEHASKALDGAALMFAPPASGRHGRG